MAKARLRGGCSNGTPLGRNATTKINPLTKPPICAQNATPGLPGVAIRPLNSCIANQRPSIIQAGTLTILKKITIQTKQRTLAIGWSKR